MQAAASHSVFSELACHVEQLPILGCRTGSADFWHAACRRTGITPVSNNGELHKNFEWIIPGTLKDSQCCIGMKYLQLNLIHRGEFIQFISLHFFLPSDHVGKKQILSQGAKVSSMPGSSPTISVILRQQTIRHSFCSTVQKWQQFSVTSCQQKLLCLFSNKAYDIQLSSYLPF